MVVQENNVLLVMTMVVVTTNTHSSLSSNPMDRWVVPLKPFRHCQACQLRLSRHLQLTPMPPIRMLLTVVTRLTVLCVSQSEFTYFRDRANYVLIGYAALAQNGQGGQGQPQMPPQ
jgi:hypothetical protein